MSTTIPTATPAAPAVTVVPPAWCANCLALEILFAETVDDRRGVYVARECDISSSLID